MPEELNLSNLKPASPRRARKRVGRGMGSGKGRYAGRGIKGQKARSGSHKMRPGFEGGQNPVYMRLGKQRGPYSKDAMPMGPFRTHTHDVKVLGAGELTKKLAVTAHRFSAGAREKIEAAGGTVNAQREPKKPKKRSRRVQVTPEASEEPATEAEAGEAPDTEEQPAAEEAEG